jgi:hypothetical protein
MNKLLKSKTKIRNYNKDMKEYAKDLVSTRNNPISIKLWNGLFDSDAYDNEEPN